MTTTRELQRPVSRSFDQDINDPNLDRNQQGEQRETSLEACENRLAEYQAREDLQPTSDCYKHEKEYVNFSEHPYLRQYQR